MTPPGPFTNPDQVWYSWPVRENQDEAGLLTMKAKKKFNENLCLSLEEPFHTRNK